MIELYHWEPNTVFLKPLIALHEKNIAFTSRYVDALSLEQYDLPAMNQMEVAHNPEGEGPILVDHGTPMTESFFITLYLDEAYPGTPLRAKDAANRWRVLMWARFVNEVLEPAVNTLGCSKYLVPALRTRDRRGMENIVARIPAKERQDGWHAALAGSYSGELMADSRRKIGLGVKKVEDALVNAEWLAGPAYSLADINAFALLSAARDLAPDLLNQRTSPRTLAWLQRIQDRPAVKAALATSRTGKPHEAYAPGPEHSRWG